MSGNVNDDDEDAALDADDLLALRSTFGDKSGALRLRLGGGLEWGLSSLTFVLPPSARVNQLIFATTT